MKAIFKSLQVLVYIYLLAGCTSLKSVELSPVEVQAKIAAGELIHAGDKVKLSFADGQKQEITVTAVTETHVYGEKFSVAIDQIIALEKREYSGTKTVLLGVGVFLVYEVMQAVALGSILGAAP